MFSNSNIFFLSGPSHKWVPHERIPALSMRTALTRYLDITTPPGQQFLRILATMAKDEGDKRKLQLLATVNITYLISICKQIHLNCKISEKKYILTFAFLDNIPR